MTATEKKLLAALETQTALIRSKLFPTLREDQRDEWYALSVTRADAVISQAKAGK